MFQVGVKTEAVGKFTTMDMGWVKKMAEEKLHLHDFRSWMIMAYQVDVENPWVP